MNGDISRIPIQSLGAVFSLTDILPELPLPSAFPHVVGNESFLTDQKLSEDAVQRLLSKDETLTYLLAKNLAQVSTEYIDLHENSTNDSFEDLNLPPLLSSILRNNSFVFFQKEKNFNDNLSKQSIKWNSQSRTSTCDRHKESFDDLLGSPSKRTRKKKKHRKQKVLPMDNDASSGVDSAAATPAGSSCGALSTTNDDLRQSAIHQVAYGVSVNVNPDEKKICLKFSIKPQSAARENHVVDYESKKNEKERKRKTTKDHERKSHRSRHDKQPDNPTSKLPQQTTVPKSQSNQLELNNIPFPSFLNGVSPNPSTKKISVSSPYSTFAEQLNRRPLPPHSTLSPNSMLDAIGNTSPLYQSIDLKAAFDQTICSSNSTKKENKYFHGNLNKDISIHNPSSENFSSLSVQSSGADFISNQSNENLIEVPLQNENSLTEANCPKNSCENEAYQGSFMIASHLEYDSKNTEVFPGEATTCLPDFNVNSLHMSTPRQSTVDTPNLEDPIVTQVRPKGLSSYINPSQVAAKQNQQTRSAQLNSINRAINQSSKPSRRKPAISRRPRRNELDGLRTWTIKYPTDSTNSASNKSANTDRITDEAPSWDAAIDGHSQAFRDRAKRRKRIALQSSDFIFENDKDYPKSSPARPDEELRSLDPAGEGSDNAEFNDIGLRDDIIASRCFRSGITKRSYAGMDDADEFQECDSYKDSEGGIRRRRKQADDDEPFEVRTKEPVEQRFPHLQKATEQVRPVRSRIRFKVSGIQDISMDAIASSNCLKKFMNRIERVLEAAVELELLPTRSSSQKVDRENDEDVATPDDISLPSEALIAPSDLAEFARDVAKLKSIGCANQVPTDRLIKLLSLLLLNIRDGMNVIPSVSQEEETNKRESRLWKERAMERITRSVQSSLISINLMTSTDMPREIYLEDVIEHAVQVTRFQLSNCIYPEYDPAYRFENSAKDNQNSIKFRRARERDTRKPTGIVQVYYKLVEIVGALGELVNMQRLTDGLLLTLSSLSVSAFFVENVSELQLAALKLITAIFSQYEAHRALIVDDIITSISRLPSSKKNLRTYRLNSEESIQMFTALALLLVQSVIELPTYSIALPDLTATDSAPISLASSKPKISNFVRPDDELLITTSYQKAMRTAHSFLAVFLKKSTTKGEDDYRVIFENFVNDLLLTVNKPEWPAAEVMLSLLGSLLVQQFNNKALDQNVRVTSVDYLGTVASTLRRDAVTSQLKEVDIDLIIKELIEGSQSDSDEEESSDASQSLKTKAEDLKDQATAATLLTLPEGSVPEETEIIPLQDGDKDFPASSNAASFQVEEKSDDVKKAVATNGRRNRRKQNPDSLNDSQLDRILVLRDATLDYLLEDDSNPVALYACKFYMAQWLEDCSKEMERAQRESNSIETAVDGDSTVNCRATNANGSSRRKCPPQKAAISHVDTILDSAEHRRQYLMDRLTDKPSLWRSRCRQKCAHIGSSSHQLETGNKPSHQSRSPNIIFKGTIDYEDAYLICRYLASLRPFSQSFDVYLSQICKLLSESSVPVRTKALRCLSAVVEADPGVLARSDIEMAVRSRLLDTSTSVREAAVDLLGRFLVCRPELTTQYYPMLSERILDKGVSVRKRVIRILRDICIEQPDFPRIAEICVMIIRRVNDEESVKKLVNEVFQTLWFTPVRDKESVKLLRKVMNITDVVSASKETGYEWFEQFLESLLKKEESEKIRPVERACGQIVESLVQNIMRLEEIPGQTNRLVACLATLHLFTKIRPQIMVKHAMLLQPYLSIRGHGSSDSLILHYVARILEVTIPLLEHPSETFLAQLEEDIVRLTLRQGKIVLESSVACLGSVVNKVSKNYLLARDCFSRFFSALVRLKDDMFNDVEKKIPSSIRPTILRALFTVGLLCKHFDANVFQSDSGPPILNQVFDTLMFFSEHIKSDFDIRKKALAGLGFLCTRHHELLCGPRLCRFYHDLLQTPHPSPQVGESDKESRPADSSSELKGLVLENILSFFLEEERRVLDSDSKWKACHKEESLKIMGDVASGIGSHVAQAYLSDLMESFFSSLVSVRLTALSVVTTILRQGLIHPVQTVPYLIALQTDTDANVRVKAENQLQEIDNKFPGFISMRATRGVCMSFRLQFVLNNSTLCTKSLTNGDLESLTSDMPVLSSSQPTLEKCPAQNSNFVRRSTRNTQQVEPSSSIVDISEASSMAASLCNESASIPSHRVKINSFSYSSGLHAIRGSRDVDCDIPSALNSQLYSMLRANRGQRRSFLNGLLNLFDDSQQLSMARLVYVADNLAFFPYQSQEEPLFIIHHIDLLVSMNGSTIIQSVRETLFPEFKTFSDSATLTSKVGSEIHSNEFDMRDEGLRNFEVGQCRPGIFSLQNLYNVTVPRSLHENTAQEVPQSNMCLLETEEEDEEVLLSRVLANGAALLPKFCAAVKASRSCLILLNVKQYLKDVYSMTDSKIQKYSPTDSSKMWERPLTRRSGVRFIPALCLRSAADEILRDINESSNPPHFNASFLERLSELPETPCDPSASDVSPDMARELVSEYCEFRKLILSIDPPDEDDVLDTSLTTIAADCSHIDGLSATDENDKLHNVPISQDIVHSLPPGRTLVPQTHLRSSDDDEEDSEDSNAGGASRLLLAQSAPQRRRTVTSSAAASRNSRSTRAPIVKRKSSRQRRLRVTISSSGDDSESSSESDISDADFA